MNLIDLFIIIVFVIYVLIEYQRGFLRLTADLVGLIIALAVGFALYNKLADFIISSWRAPVLYAKPLSFLAIWITVQLLFFGLSKLISHFTPSWVKESAVNSFLGIIPAALKAVFFIAVTLILVVIIPLDQKTKNLFTSSFFGQRILNSAVKFQSKLEKIFGGENGGITFIDQQNGHDEQTPLNFTTTQAEPDEAAEKVMLDKINEERLKVGAAPLTQDILVRNVARVHSRDMLLRGYFSHYSADGKSLADRLMGSNANFIVAAENLALAPNANLAHLGLMGSEKHRINILDPEYTRVGIGVMNAGQYGIMVTEDFVK